MDTSLRPTGIEGVGAMPWGTHFCLFYETDADLLDVMVPYFKAGLENHEVCLWVAPLSADEARQALGEAVPHFERCLGEGQTEIISYTDGYLQGGHFDSRRVVRGWIDKLAHALANGYAGLRLAGNTFWLERHHWDSFVEYEAEINEVFSKSRIVAVCTYDLGRCSAADVLDVVRHHQFTLARRNGVWEHLEGSELKRAHDEIRKLNADLERRVAERTAQLIAANEKLRAEIAERRRAEAALQEGQRRWQALFDNSVDGIMILDDEARYVDANPAACGLLGFSREELLRLRAWDVTPEASRDLARQSWKEFLSAGKSDGEYTLVRKDGTCRQVAYRSITNFRPGVHITVFHDITERKQAEKAIRLQSLRAQLLADISHTFAEVGLDYQGVLRTVAQRTADLIGDACVIHLLSDDGQQLKPVAFHHANPERLALMGDIALTAPVRTDTEYRRVLLSGEPVCIPVLSDVLRAALSPEFPLYFGPVDAHSLLIVPLRVPGRVIGTLGMARDHPEHPYTPDDQALLQDLADRAALTIQNARLFQAVNEHRGADRRFASEVEIAAYRIIQEGLTNVARHAGVQEAAVHVWVDKDTFGLQIEDEGTGFDVEAALAGRTSSGLSGMRERAALLGGRLTIESAPGAGTQITAELPVRGRLERRQDERDDPAGR